MAGKVVVSTLNNDTGVLATQNGMTGIAKAWVNFNGTGTVAIRDSFNVSSITDNGTGDFTVNFTTVLPNANYSAVGTGVQLANLGSGSLVFISATTSAYRFSNRDANNGLADGDTIFVAIFSS